MNLYHSVKTSYTGLRTNLIRSILTIVGIVIGVAAIIVIVSLGNGAQNLILSQVQGLGSKTIIVIPGEEQFGPQTTGVKGIDSLKPSDVDALKQKQNVPHAHIVMPIVIGSGDGVVNGNTFNVSVFGATGDMADMFDLQPTTGTFFSAEEVRSNSLVAVIGSKVKEQLFPNEDPIGKRVKISNQSFTVIGLLPSKGGTSLINFDNAALIPYTTAQNYLFGIKYFNRIFIEADVEKNIQSTQEDIITTLRASHRLEGVAKSDFTIQNQADLASKLGTITSVLTYFLVAVAAISLLVGGIGIMNIMLVSVTERTREIGLRKAVGAHTKDILTQFLLEAIFLTLAGGLAGIILGTIISFVISFILGKILGFGWTFSFPYFAAFVGVFVSGLVGVVFGIYPASQASKKSPIEALRYE